MSGCARLVLPVLLVLFGSADPAGALSTAYTTRAAFLAALAGAPTVVDFESAAPGTAIPSGSAFEGVTLQYAIAGGLTVQVVSNFDTTSGANALGLDDPGNFDQFLDGDELDFVFAGSIFAFGLYLVSGDPLVAGDVVLETVVGDAPNGALQEQTLADGGLVYFLGLVSTDPFDTVLLRYDGGDHFFFNLDDLTWSVPESPGLGCLAALTLGVLARRREGKR